MLIGLTYDLRAEYLAAGHGLEETAEFDRLDTIEALEHTLARLGHLTERVGNVKALVERLAAGRRWDLVFNIAEGLSGFGREAQVPALLDAYAIPYTFSDPLVMSVCLHKGVTKRVLASHGLPTPECRVVEHVDDVARIDLPLPLFAKPIAEGTGKGVAGYSIIRSRDELTRVCRRLLRRFRQPVLVERFLPGREFTVGVLGTGSHARIVGVIEIILGERADRDVYSFDNKELFEDRVEYRVATDDLALRSAAIALESWRAIGGRDAGRIDMRSDERGEPQLIEINPLPGLNPGISDLPILCSLYGVSYRRLIGDIVASARNRMPRAARTTIRSTERGKTALNPRAA